MILADKIINERKKNGWSQEELAEKLSVSRQSISKWEGAQAVPDLQKILKMAELFGVSTDYLLKDDLEPEKVTYSTEPLKEEKEIRTVTLEEADTYLKLIKKVAPVIANGVSLCIISPVLLLILCGLSEMGKISEAIMVATGITVLLVLVAIAVFMFITSSAKTKKYEFLEKEIIETAYGVTGMVKEKQKDFEHSRISSLALGVILCILSAIPVIVVSVLTENAIYVLLSVSCLLVLVSLGVNLIVRSGIIAGSYHKLLQEEDYSKEAKKTNAMMEPIAGIYWAVVLGIYLFWSFKTNAWASTWIVWPISALFYGVLQGIMTLIKKNK